MERSEPFVPGHFPGAVIAVKEPVMQLVKEITKLKPGLIPEFHMLEPGMGCRCPPARTFRNWLLDYSAAVQTR